MYNVTDKESEVCEYLCMTRAHANRISTFNAAVLARGDKTRRMCVSVCVYHQVPNFRDWHGTPVH